MKRLLDFAVSLAGLVALWPLLGLILFLVWRQDRHSPFYVAPRVGRGGQPFSMVKIRSMIVNADATGVESTGGDDHRITPLGHFIRRWKLDEVSQLWNVLKGDMSLVGPRPNTVKEVATYSLEERGLLAIRPGITDFASIVFSDEGQILAGAPNPDAEYERLIRPWKSQLGLIYVRNSSVWLDLKLIYLTALAIVDKPAALAGLQPLLGRLGAPRRLLQVASRREPLALFAASVE